MSLSCLIILASSGLGFPAVVGTAALTLMALVPAAEEDADGRLEAVAVVAGAEFVSVGGCDESVILSESRLKVA